MNIDDHRAGHGVPRHLRSPDLVAAVQKAFEDSERIGTSGVVISDDKVRLCMNFHLEMPAQAWEALGDLACGTKRSRAAILRRIAKDFLRSRLAHHTRASTAGQSAPAAASAIADRIMGRYGE